MTRTVPLNATQADENGSDNWFTFASDMTNTLPSLSSLDLFIPEVLGSSDIKSMKGLDYFDMLMGEDSDNGESDDDLSYYSSVSKSGNLESSTVATSASSSLSTSSSSFRSRQEHHRQRSVTFSTVETREYGLVVGDHPMCRDGLSLSLDWKFNHETTIVNVETYDTQKYGDLNSHTSYDYNRDNDTRREFSMRRKKNDRLRNANNDRRSKHRPVPLNYFERKNRLKIVSGLDDVELLSLQSQIFTERENNCWYEDEDEYEDDCNDSDDEFYVAAAQYDKKMNRKSSFSPESKIPPIMEVVCETRECGARKRR